MIHFRMFQVLDQYEEANFGEYMDPRDPDVLGQHEADTEDPIFQEYIIARRKLKGPAYTPSSFNFDADEVPYLSSAISSGRKRGREGELMY